MKKAEEDAASQRNQFEKDRKGLEDTKKQLLANLETQRTTYEGKAAELDATIKDLNDKLGKSEHAKQNLLAEVSKSSDTFEVADGRVSLVNQNGTVWINLTKAHYGIHGTPDPGRIRHRESYGCIRLTNSHAADLSHMVIRGTPAPLDE